MHHFYAYSAFARRALSFALLALAVGTIGARGIAAADAKAPNVPDDKIIRATAEAFTEAFNRGSAKDVAALWTPDGSLVDETGKLLKGRAAIEEAYANLFKEHPGAKIEIVVQSVEFPTAALAVEDGISKVTSDGAAPSASRYTAVHTASGGKWLMASVRESAVEAPTSAARLSDLKWLVGKWQAKVDNTTFESNIHWISNDKFLARDYTARRDGKVVSSGTQIVGWDPNSGQLRSWSFDSAGGLGAGEWQRSPDGWRIYSTGVLADGTETSSIDRLIQVAGQEGVFGWRSADRHVGNADLPNTPEIVFDRTTEKRTAEKRSE